jgi:hypothetical protein
MILNRALKMNHSSAQLMKLPDELLLIILKKLDHTDVLYSLLGLSIRLDQIIRDPCFPTEINLIKLKDDETSGQVETWIDRFCLDILPTIGHRIKWLKVRSTSMERILLAADYPNLSQLDIFVQGKAPVLHFNGEKTLGFSSAGSFVHEHRSTFVRPRAKILSRLTIHA